MRKIPRGCFTISFFALVFVIAIHHHRAYAEDLGEQNVETQGQPSGGIEEGYPKRELLFFEEVPVVISATKQEQPITQSPSSISVITAEDIRRSGATNIADLLRRVPGLDVMRLTPSDASISARGFNEPANNNMLLLIDGRSAYVDFFGIVLWDDLPIVLEEIERIEIIRGPGSALYGANAFSGVINIITKTPEQAEGTLLSATGGEFDTVLATFMNADVRDNWSYKVVASWDQANSFDDRDDNDHRMFKGNALVNYQFDPESKLYFSTGANTGTGNTLTQLAEFDRDGTEAYAKVNYDYENWKFQAYYNLVNTDVTPEGTSDEMHIINNALDFEMQHSFNLRENHVITWGANYRYNEVSSHDIIGDDTKEENLFAVFLQDQYKILDNLTLTAGARLDSHPITGIHFSPRASLVYEPWQNHIFRGSVSRAFRNPSFVESYLDLVIVNPPLTVTSLGDDDFEAEEITSFELGYQVLLFDNRLEFKLDTFYNILDDLIGFERTVPPPDVELRFVETGEATAFGGEASLVYRPANWLSSYVNYSYQELKALDNGVQFQLNEEDGLIKSSPRHKVNAGLYAELNNGLNGSVDLNFVSKTVFGFFDQAAGFEPTEEELDDYTRVDARVGYKFPNRDIEASLIIQNALNDVHREFPLGEELRRVLLFRVSGRF